MQPVVQNPSGVGMLTLYFSPGASSMATHIALKEIDAPFELNYIPLHQHANRETGYLGVNPEGKEPTLLIDGRALTEVAATLWHLARRYPAAGLLRPAQTLPKALRGIMR